MIRAAAGFGGAAMVALVAACGSSSPTGTSTPAGASSSTTTATTGGTGLAGGGVNATQDPCQLVTASEASSLAGTTFTSGTEQTNTDTANPGGGSSRQCIYGGATTNVFEVLVADASSASAAQADWAAEEAQVQSKLSSSASQLPPGTNLNFNINDTSISGADRAATGTFSTTIQGVTLSGSAMYLLKGAAFVAFTDLVVGHAGPGVSAMESQAGTTVGRM